MDTDGDPLMIDPLSSAYLPRPSSHLLRLLPLPLLLLHLLPALPLGSRTVSILPGRLALINLGSTFMSSTQRVNEYLECGLISHEYATSLHE